MLHVYRFSYKFPAKHELHTYSQFFTHKWPHITTWGGSNLARAMVRRRRSLVSDRLEGTRISTGWILRTLASSSERDELSLKQSTITSPMLGCTTWDTATHRNPVSHRLHITKPAMYVHEKRIQKCTGSLTWKVCFNNTALPHLNLLRPQIELVSKS